MSIDEDLSFSFRAEVPKENIQVLDSVLNELFGSLSSKMKQAGEFLETVKMRPPTLQNGESEEVDEEEDQPEEDGADVDSDGEDDEEKNDADDEADECCGDDDDDEEEVDEEQTDGYEEEEVEFVFLLRENGEISGFSDTLREAMDFLDRRYQEVVVKANGMVRTERTATEIRGYQRTPYLWFMFSERPVYHGKIEILTKV
jgi:hypothetical protein